MVPLTMRAARGLPHCVVCCCAVLVLSGSATASVSAQRAPVFLEPGHWVYDAIRRMNVAGMAPAASDPALAPVTLQHAAAVFAHAAGEAERRGRGDLARLATGYGALLEPLAPSGLLARLELRAGWLARSGEVLAGDGYFPDEDWEGAVPYGSRRGPIGAVRAHGWLHENLAWLADAGRYGDVWTVPAATITVAAGPFDAWAGRRRLHYGAGRGGATVLGAGTGDAAYASDHVVASFDGVGVHVREPFHFPGFLRVLGPDRIEIVAGRLTRSGRVDQPYVIFGRLTGMPFTRRLTLGVNRGAIFGGSGNPITLGRMLGLLAGVHGGEGGEFENQVISAVVRFRPPFGSLGLELYAEIGADDTAGAISDVPASVTGFDLGALPGAAPLALGLEHTRYPRSCCGNPIWYRSIFFRGSWADEGRLFAHPLGGHGSEWLAHARLDLPQHGALLRLDAFTRRRGTENLFAPGRDGHSRGAALSIDVAGSRATSLRIDGGFENGSGWSQRRLSAALSHHFAGPVW